MVGGECVCVFLPPLFLARVKAGEGRQVIEGPGGSEVEMCHQLPPRLPRLVAITAWGILQDLQIGICLSPFPMPHPSCGD